VPVKPLYPMSAPSASEQAESEERVLARAVLELNGNILGLVLGIVAAIGIFVATNWLVIKGGDRVGPHLSLLGQFFIGYRVTLFGSLIGMVYGLAGGYLAGRIIAGVYNEVLRLRHR
jgi:hypothetical protein